MSLVSVRVEACGDLASTAVAVLWIAHLSILQDLDIFSAGSTGSAFAGGHIESTRLLTGPGLITWALGCTFGTLLFV